MHLCLLDGLAKVNVIMQISPQQLDEMYFLKIEAWPPLHNHPLDFCIAIRKDGEEPYRHPLKTKDTIYVSSHIHYDNVVDWLITCLFVHLKQNKM